MPFDTQMRSDVTDGPSDRPLIRIWDLPIRIFHWLLVLSVSVALITGFVSPEWYLGLHLTAGYAVLLLLIFRFVWGVFGSEYARLVNLAQSMRDMGGYLRGLAMLRPPHYVGHNPAGALMIFAFFAVFLGLAVSGLLVQGGEEKHGPLAGYASYALGHDAKGLHELLAYAVLAMIAIHICGVFIESWLQKTNLVAGMITGLMPLPDGFKEPPRRQARPFAALLVFSVIATACAAILLSLARFPPAGVPAMAVSETYRSECGACHWPFHPSLLPRASWNALMGSLSSHFGEDASLAPEKSAEIAKYLDSYAAEAWDTEAGNRFRAVSSVEPLRITKSRYWTTKHRNIPAANFKSAGVKSESNCIVCHKDGDSGRFDDQSINVPQGAAQ